MHNFYFIHKDFRLNGTIFKDYQNLLSFCEKLDKESYLFLKDWFNKKEFVVVQTSGSTGAPKQIRLLKQHMIASAKATAQYFNLPNNTTALHCLPSKYIAGKMMWVRALVLGWDLDWVEASGNVLQNNSKSYDFGAMVPTQLKKSLKNIVSIDKLIVGGGAMSTELLFELKNLKTKIFATYGMTETITHIAVKKINNCKASEESYTALDNVFLSIDNRNCLVINAPYISNKETITNDLVELISDKKFILKGRYDNIINSGGIKYIPEELEEKLGKFVDNNFFITSMPDVTLGEKIILIIEGEKAPISFLEQVFDRYEKPKEIYFLPHFIYTETGKINRKETLKLLIPKV